MRKLSRAAAAIALAVLVQGVFANAVSAGPTVNVGDLLKFSNGPGVNGGGEFGVSVNGAPESFITFCVERTEGLNFDDQFVVAGISTTSQSSGVPLHAGTAYLYTLFHNGNLPGYAHTNAKATSLQLAIWHFQNQLAVGPGGDLTAAFLADADAQAYVAAAAGAVGTGAVKILNMQTLAGGLAQDVLIVPEPASVLAWSLIGGCFVVGNRLRRGKWLLG